MTLSPRDAALRTEALQGLRQASLLLDGGYAVKTAWSEAAYDRPRVALREIAKAKAALSQAEQALRKWAGR